MNVNLIGIAGSSCSGKTTLLKAIKDKFGDGTSTLSFDEYFVGNTKYDLDSITNFERPDLYDYDKFVADLKLLKSGKDLKINTNSRESQQGGQSKAIIKSNSIIFVEGFLIFYAKEARDLFETKVYIDLDDDEILKRRFARSAGDKHWDSTEYIQSKLIPYHHKYVEPQRKYADLVLSGKDTAQQLLKQVSDLVF